MSGAQTTLTEIFLATSPKSGDRKRVRLLPELAANSTSPLGSNAACTARTSEWNGSTCHAPTSAGLKAAGAATSAPNRTLAESAASAMMDLCYTGQRGDLGRRERVSRRGSSEPAKPIGSVDLVQESTCYTQRAYKQPRQAGSGPQARSQTWNPTRTTMAPGTAGGIGVGPTGHTEQSLP